MKREIFEKAKALEHAICRTTEALRCINSDIEIRVGECYSINISFIPDLREVVRQRMEEYKAECEKELEEL